MANFIDNWKFRKVRHRYSMVVPNVVVRSQFPKRWYLIAGFFLLVLIVAAVELAFQRNRPDYSVEEIEALRLKVRQLDDEVFLLRSTSGTGPTLALMERSAQALLLDRLRVLELENANLKEDMLLYERLIPLPDDLASVRIENFRVSGGVETGYRYRLFVAFQPTRQAVEFRGRIQFLLVCQVDGREFQVAVPEKKGEHTDFSVEVKHFLRKEGVLDLPSGALLIRAEARIFQGDLLKAKQVAKL